MTRTLIAAFGNVLRGDDGFGVAVLERLAERGVETEQVILREIGTGGIRLAQELTDEFDRLIVLDAAMRGGTPGSVYTLAVVDVQPTREIDMHTAIPSRALEVARALGPLPREIYFVGCEPAEVDELTLELSPRVAAAVDIAVEEVERLLRDPMPAPDAQGAGDSIAREDELLELLYWFEGEEFRGAADLRGIVRFTAIEEATVRRTLDRLIARGDVVVDTSSGGEQYRLTEPGRREAARRFAAEFAPMLSQGHGECNDPDCDCHTSEGGAAECHGRGQKHEH